MNDVMLTTDTGQSMALVLLDLSSAFDLVDHNILLSCLEKFVGLRGTVLQWFHSYLTNRSYSVCLRHHSSSNKQLSSGVPLGSILGPVLSNLYMLPFGSIISRYGVSFHLYADDTQIYLPIKRDDKLAFKPIFDCLDELKLWLASNFLSLNESKTEIILFGSNDHSTHDVDLDTLLPYSTTCVRNLGVLLDNSLKFDKQKVKPFLSGKNLETVMHAFVTSRLDFCNSLYIGASQTCVTRLQLLQNAAAWLLKGKRKCDHITPVLISLHWLQVKYRIDLKVLLFVFKSLRNQAPQYLSELLHPPSQSRSLRSRNSDLLYVPRTRLKNRGDRAFAAIGPKLWNSLPAYIRSAQTLSTFKSALKTYFFPWLSIFLDSYWH
uniref:Reverse transcriptase domain-containing protein n=1 Tax=Cyprinus carpio TaxID=7962 RepID=A0A8C1RU53_CYPCA